MKKDKNMKIQKKISKVYGIEIILTKENIVRVKANIVYTRKNIK